MMMDIFSSFDPYTHSLFSFNQILLWGTSTFIIFLFMQSFWLSPPTLTTLMFSMKTIMVEQTMRTRGTNMKSFIMIIPIMFVFIIAANLMGLLPYMFSTSSHLIFTLSMGLPMWLALVLSSFFHNTYSATAALLPAGAPAWLNPFLVLVETLSTLVRPLTLSFRLAANMTAGHVVLGLMGSYLSNSMTQSLMSLTFMSSLMITTLYVMFEIGICLIQSYIFCLLLTLYSDDHS